MAIEAIEDQPLNDPAVASRQNGEALAAATPMPSATSGDVSVTDLTERIEELEQQHRQLTRDSLLIAGLTTIAAALAIATMIENRLQPRVESQMQPIVNPRTISAQAFLLTDTHGRPRAKLTFE